MWHDEVLLHVDDLVGCGGAQRWHLLAALVKELLDRETLGDLERVAAALLAALIAWLGLGLGLGEG